MFIYEKKTTFTTRWCGTDRDLFPDLGIMLESYEGFFRLICLTPSFVDTLIN